jgi:DNA ligase 1
MQFLTLCEYFQKLEKTSKRLEIIEILSGLIDKLELSEIQPALYLCLGEIGADYKQVNLGIKEKFMLKVISKITGSQESEVTKKFSEIGDVGDIVELLSSGHKQSNIDDFFDISETTKTYSIKNIWDFLQEISIIEGSGSIGQKQEKIANFCKDLNPLEQKYLFRAMVGKTRLGAKASSWIDATALLLGSKELNSKIEYAYNISSDLGLTLELAIKYKDVNKLIEEIKITPGIPIKVMTAQRAASTEEVFKRLGEECYIEAKYDGYRIQIHKNNDTVSLWSRNQENYNIQFPDAIDEATKALPNNIILEGEIVAFDYSTNQIQNFQILANRGKKHNIEEDIKNIKVKIFIFDILYHNENYMNRSFLDRRNYLESLSLNTNMIEVIESIKINVLEDLDQYSLDAKEEYLEGVMLKSFSKDAIYEPGKRSFYWLKLKSDYIEGLTDSFDLVVIGAFAGKGKRAGWYGTLLLAAYDPETSTFKSICKLGAGLTENNMAEFTDLINKNSIPNKLDSFDVTIKPEVWVEPILILEVSAAEISSSPVHTVPALDGKKKLALRFPRFTGRVRDDKKVPDGITTVQEIQEISKKLKIGY